MIATGKLSVTAVTLEDRVDTADGESFYLSAQVTARAHDKIVTFKCRPDEAPAATGIVNVTINWKAAPHDDD